MRFFALPALFGLILFPLPAAAKESTPVSLAKVSKWELRYDQGACHLISTIGHPVSLTVSFTRFEPGDEFTLSFSGAGLTNVRRWSEASLTFGTGKPSELIVFMTIFDGTPTIVLPSQRLDGLPVVKTGRQPAPISPALEAGVSSLSVTLAGIKPMTIELGSLAKPFAALRSCTTDLIRSWGYDPQVYESLRQPSEPVDSPGNWVTVKDYPDTALSQRLEGIATFRLDIDPRGRVIGCGILESSGASVLDLRTCQVLLTRARFRPAIDESGTAIKSFFVSKVRWRLPDY